MLKSLWLLFGVVLFKTPHLLCDNISALHMTINLVLHGWTKLLEIEYHFVREKVLVGHLATQHIPSYLWIADIQTKSLSSVSFQNFQTKLGVYLLAHTSLRGRDEVTLINGRKSTTIQSAIHDQICITSKDCEPWSNDNNSSMENIISIIQEKAIKNPSMQTSITNKRI